ncbi:MAG: Aminotransferase class-III [Sedimentibacter sp.]|nr:Aminotransferase class-III [Sedimentibacter sp.]
MMLGLDVGDYASLIKERAMEEKVLINVTSGTVIRLIPPLTINTNDIDMLISVLEKIISRI